MLIQFKRVFIAALFCIFGFLPLSAQDLTSKNFENRVGYFLLGPDQNAIYLGEISRPNPHFKEYWSEPLPYFSGSRIIVHGISIPFIISPEDYIVHCECYPKSGSGMDCQRRPIKLVIISLSPVPIYEIIPYENITSPWFLVGVKDRSKAGSCWGGWMFRKTE